jgi:hypothetical protein
MTSTLPTEAYEPGLPISTALSEAQPDSLQELFSRDHFGLSLTPVDFEVRIDEMRRQRDRLVEADLECQRLAKAKAEAKKARRKASRTITTATLAEFGL